MLRKRTGRTDRDQRNDKSDRGQRHLHIVTPFAQMSESINRGAAEDRPNTHQHKAAWTDALYQEAGREDRDGQRDHLYNEPGGQTTAPSLRAGLLAQRAYLLAVTGHFATMASQFVAQLRYFVALYLLCLFHRCFKRGPGNWGRRQRPHDFSAQAGAAAAPVSRGSAPLTASVGAICAAGAGWGVEDGEEMG